MAMTNVITIRLNDKSSSKNKYYMHIIQENRGVGDTIALLQRDSMGNTRILAKRVEPHRKIVAFQEWVSEYIYRRPNKLVS